LEYVHYGTLAFDRSKYRPVKNHRYPWAKPDGGFWASPIGAKKGWKDWCEQEQFVDCKEENSFKFRIKESANVLHIRDRADLLKVPQFPPDWEGDMNVKPDFEKLMEDGVDAIELHLSEDGRLYWALYGWDCDSILIMNSDIILI
jgi:hypothetical protein